MSNIISNPTGDHNDKIANAARVLGRSPQRRKVFEAIYNGKRKIKTVTQIAELSGLSNKRVLEEAAKLHAAGIIDKLKKGGTAYQKDDFYTHNKRQILNIAGDKKKLNAFPTKVTPRINGGFIRVEFPKKLISIDEITIDDMTSFMKVASVKSTKLSATKIKESQIKEGFKKILGEDGTFTDWGGESNDLFSSRLLISNKRITVAFGFKGRATKGILVPKKLGKNGDQIQRLFKSPAAVYIIQYHGQIDPSVIEQMKLFATAKSISENMKVYYGVIDGQDTSRLLEAYPVEFKI